MYTGSEKCPNGGSNNLKYLKNKLENNTKKRTYDVMNKLHERDSDCLEFTQNGTLVGFCSTSCLSHCGPLFDTLLHNEIQRQTGHSNVIELGNEFSSSTWKNFFDFLRLRVLVVL